jgi:glucose uptake protein GlcU
MLLAAASPATGDTRDMKTPVIVAIVAVVLIIVCLLLSGKPKNKENDSEKDKK